MRPVRLLAAFQRLRWKLTFSYTVVTVAVLLTLVTVALVVSSSFGRPSQALSQIQEAVASGAAEASPLLEAAPADATALEAWLRRAIANDRAVIVSPSGELLASNTEEAAREARSGQPYVDPVAPGESQALIDQALGGNPGLLALPDGSILSAHPILGEGDSVLGVLYLRSFTTALIPGYNLAASLPLLVVSLIVVTLAAGLVGTVFGWLTSRGLVRRLEGLDRATEAWGQGDFSATADDASPDEIGQLARRMSRMAGQIQDLLRVRQDLAASEERNRLARDLHDSVKQQVFATTMTLGTAETLREQDPEAAWRMIGEALELSWEAQQELTGLIHELRPVALEELGLAAALQEYASRWSYQAGVETNVDVPGEATLPPEVEATLYRLAQEALANVAKHSGASRVEITLACREGGVTLEVADDGCGFDPSSVAGWGMGLRSMRERIEALDGELSVESTRGAGTRLIARCDLR